MGYYTYRVASWVCTSLRTSRPVHAGPCSSARHGRCRCRCSRAADEGLGRRLHAVDSFPPFAGDARTRLSGANRSNRRCRNQSHPAGAAGGSNDHRGYRRVDRLRFADDPRRAGNAADAHGSSGNAADAHGSSGSAADTHESDARPGPGRPRFGSIRGSISSTGDITRGDAAACSSATTSGEPRRPDDRSEPLELEPGCHSGRASEPTARRGATADPDTGPGSGRCHDRAVGRIDHVPADSVSAQLDRPAGHVSAAAGRARSAAGCARSVGGNAVSEWQYE